MRAAALVVLAACGAPAAPAPVAASAPAPASAAPDAALPDANQEEVLAAIQKAMNELAPASQQCWAAAAAVDGFRIAGDLVLRVDVPGHAELVSDTARNKRLADCMVALLASYRYAPPLTGQSFQLPFHFAAPTDGQNTIDRRYVPTVAQGDVGVAVLVDEVNSGNPAVSMFELTIAAGKTTGPRRTERAELWYFLTPATIGVQLEHDRAVAAGDMMFVPANGEREVRAGAAEVKAVVVAVPGGREGAARGGALPTPIYDVTGGGQYAAPPEILPAAKAKTYGIAQIFFEGGPLSAAILTLPAGTVIPPHVHAHETELLYLLAGSATLALKPDAQFPVRPTTVVQLPPNTSHSLAVEEPLRALQIYTPAGPEQRFKKPR